jgi:hypothetical protein
VRCEAHAAALLEQQLLASSGTAPLSNRIYQSIGFRKSTPPHNCQINTLIRNSKQQVDDFVGS